MAELSEHGLLLETDRQLPNVCALVTGETVRGSWWAHPRSHDIFRVNCALADHMDVLVTKLISGKVTFVHRSLWPAVIAAGQLRTPEELEPLSPAARKLLLEVDNSAVESDRENSKAISELEKRGLVYGEQFHGATGAHGKRIESWLHWSKRRGFVSPPLNAMEGRDKLEAMVAHLNRKFNARARLPWQA
ncbi:MAG TPA: hypothetical protein VJN43_15390 [Bryobacteraceae bacterium]|nr:hypothetical protein [Bryobacteraceae bacterium]